MGIPAVIRKPRQPSFTADLRRSVARIVAENPGQVKHRVEGIEAMS